MPLLLLPVPYIPYSRKIWREFRIGLNERERKYWRLLARSSHAPNFSACARYWLTYVQGSSDVTTLSSIEQYGVGDSSYMRVHRVFKHVWTPTIGDQLSCKRKIERRYAVAGSHHIPRKISAACSSLFSAAYFQIDTLSSRV